MMFPADLEPIQWFCNFRYTKPTKWSPRPKRTARRTLSERKQHRAARQARSSR
jgi:hypothetical protein